MSVALIVAWLLSVGLFSAAVYNTSRPAPVPVCSAPRDKQKTIIPGITVDADKLGESLARHYRRKLVISDLERCGAVLWIMDADGVILYTTGRGLERFGVDRGEVIGTNIYDWPMPEAYRAAADHLIEHPNSFVVQDLPQWVKPARATYARTRAGLTVGVAIPAPLASDPQGA